MIFWGMNKIIFLFKGLKNQQSVNNYLKDKMFVFQNADFFDPVIVFSEYNGDHNQRYTLLVI